MGKLGSSDGCQLHHLLSFASIIIMIIIIIIIIIIITIIIIMMMIIIIIIIIIMVVNCTTSSPLHLLVLTPLRQVGNRVWKRVIVIIAIIIIIAIVIIIIIDHHANLFQALNQFRHNCTPTWLFIASGLKFCVRKKRFHFDFNIQEQ